MVQRTGGSRRKTRSKFKRNIKERGKIRIRKFLQEFKIGDRVVLKAEPSYQKGIYHARFHGRAGKVSGKQGRCYKVKIMNFNKEKTFLVHPVHLKRLK